MEVFDVFSNPDAWVALLTLTFLEIVLGVDNIIFISIASSKLPKEEQKKATNIGLLLAMILRIILLFGISILVAMNAPFWEFKLPWIAAEVSGQAVILFLGGIFLLYKSTKEIHDKVEAPLHGKEHVENKRSSSLSKAIIQITMINIVFSFDSILTAIGMTNGISENPDHALVLMIIAVVISMAIMMLFANPVGRFVNNNPSIQILGLSFLILIGFMLIAEAAHLSHLAVLDSKVGTIPKGYLYFTISFSLFVEFLNLRRQKNKSIQ
jgi:predicted tellurium resistance membrane protein TerC